jgi:hypothetical protein
MFAELARPTSLEMMTSSTGFATCRKSVYVQTPLSPSH